jgi:hypothetical protein
MALWMAAAGYEVARTPVSRDVLLGGDARAWTAATSISWGPPEYVTTFRALWDDEGLYVRWDAVDPRPWHRLTERDAPLFKEEVVEIFLDLDRSGTHYAEIEINPAGAVCDVRIVHPLPAKEGDPPWKGDFSWNLEGTLARVAIDKSADKTTGWTALAFLPWKGLASLPSAASIALPPKAGDRWRFNVFRIERPHGPEEPERDLVLAAWSPTGIPKFHVTAAFRDLVFLK